MKCSCGCGKTLNKGNKNGMHMTCRRNRLCTHCGVPIGSTSKSGLCRSCVQTKKFKLPLLRTDEKKIIPSQIIPRYELFEFLETIDIDYYVKWKTREFIKNYPLIYKNIIYYSYNKKGREYNLNKRIHRILNDSYVLCNVNSYDHLLLKNGPVQGFIKFQHHYTERKGIGNLDWYKRKYPDTFDEEYKKRYDKIFSRLPYSKISQELFDKLNVGGKYATNGGEQRFYISETDRINFNLNQKYIFVDYIYNNKIIEFDGTYWHRNTQEKDRNKTKFLEHKGFDILRIDEKSYNQNKGLVVDRCLKFLKHQ